MTFSKKNYQEILRIKWSVLNTYETTDISNPRFCSLYHLIPKNFQDPLLLKTAHKHIMHKVIMLFCIVLTTCVTYSCLNAILLIYVAQRF